MAENDGRAPRSKPTSPKDLSGYAARLRTAAAAIEGAAKKLEKQGGGPFDVEGHGMMTRAFKWIDKFLSHVLKHVEKF